MQRQSIHIKWVPTKDMIADALTKALSASKHEDFVKMTGIEDQRERLASLKKENDLREALQQRRVGIKHSEAFGFGSAS